MFAFIACSMGGGSQGNNSSNQLSGTTWEGVLTRAQMAANLGVNEQELKDFDVIAEMPQTIAFNSTMGFVYSGMAYDMSGGINPDDTLFVSWVEQITFSYTGTYSITGNTITLTFTSGEWGGEVITATISGNTLGFFIPSDEYGEDITITFTKK